MDPALALALGLGGPLLGVLAIVLAVLSFRKSESEKAELRRQLMHVLSYMDHPGLGRLPPGEYVVMGRIRSQVAAYENLLVVRNLETKLTIVMTASSIPSERFTVRAQ